MGITQTKDQPHSHEMVRGSQGIGLGMDRVFTFMKCFQLELFYYGDKLLVICLLFLLSFFFGYDYCLSRSIPV
ncbi:hypothetical protein K449DRAFT_34458 [Hypoxylon sp. EC38]|nr:hypothetical protein K449DRAFT_34458 [Hypoxylon sp. EC38]